MALLISFIVFAKDDKVELKNAPPNEVTLNSGFEEVAVGLDISF